ncbi:MAG TPA: Stp1/IreP family PP2C-type Ser/Thr phosphatase [Candidatus Binataceae bacterium]|nr:Stp1/IreP family PP2C-type Ser/Thr phosphatase [Candidatus Binataceae bacterium]
MIVCPECSQSAPDDATFCDRCGRALAIASAAPAAPGLAELTPGAVIKGRFEIIESTSHSAEENRYLVRRTDGDPALRFQLRERIGPPPDPDREPLADAVAERSGEGSAADEDPAGPRAKTAELNPEVLKGGPTVEPVAHAESAEASDVAAVADPGTAQEADDAPAPPASALANGSESRAPIELTPDEIAEPDETANGAAAPDIASGAVGAGACIDAGATMRAAANPPAAPIEPPDDLGDLFGRVLALSITLDHPAFQRATEGFADAGRVYLVYPNERLTTLAERRGGIRMSEAEALSVAIQIAQATAFLHRRGLRLNDICPHSVAYGADGRIRVLGLDYVSNDTELQPAPILNDGFTAPEVYRGKAVDKRADVFSIGALLYSCLTGERLESETWREEAGPIRFYPPHVVSPRLEEAVRQALAYDPQARWASVDALKAELVKLNGELTISAAALTDVGVVRDHNEDAVMSFEYRRDSLVEPSRALLYVVCDGMGGAEAGEVAAAIAVGAMRNYVESRLGDAAAANPGNLLVAALEEANRQIIEYQTAHPEARGMGSTGVGALIMPSGTGVAWVGDSRAYIMDAGELRQVTRDHSLVQRLIEIGQITPEEARHHEHKNVITRSLGARQSGPAGAEAKAVRLKRGDRMLLCSDGLIAHVDDPNIAEIMRRHDDPWGAARELVVAANAGGGTDNVSVIVIFTN